MDRSTALVAIIHDQFASDVLEDNLDRLQRVLSGNDFSGCLYDGSEQSRSEAFTSLEV